MNIVTESTANLQEISDLLSKGAVISYPTDTVYALSCDSANSEAIKKIYNLKDRPLNKPLAMFVKNIDEAKQIGQFPDNTPEDILQGFKDGKITFLLNIRDDIKDKKSDNRYNSISPLLYQQNDKIGIRIPNHQFCQKLLKAFDKPIVATSTNPAGESPSTSGEEVVKYFNNNNILELVVFEDNSNNVKKEAKPSKIVDLSDKNYKFIR